MDRPQKTPQENTDDMVNFVNVLMLQKYGC